MQDHAASISLYPFAPVFIAVLLLVASNRIEKRIESTVEAELRQVNPEGEKIPSQDTSGDASGLSPNKYLAKVVADIVERLTFITTSLVVFFSYVPFLGDSKLTGLVAICMVLLVVGAAALLSWMWDFPLGSLPTTESARQWVFGRTFRLVWIPRTLLIMYNGIVAIFIALHPGP